jgi:hypothetical protein
MNGLEPASSAPPARRSSQTELHPAGAARRNRTGIPCLEGRHTSRCVSAAHRDPEPAAFSTGRRCCPASGQCRSLSRLPLGSNQRPPGFQPSALPTELESHGRDGRTRTCGLLNPNQAPYQAGPHPGECGRPPVEVAARWDRAVLRTRDFPPWTARDSNPETFSLQGSCSTSWS